MSESELRQEIAILLYQLTIHYGVEDFEQDMATLRGLGRL